MTDPTPAKNRLDALRIERRPAPPAGRPVIWIALLILVLAVGGGLAWRSTRAAELVVSTTRARAVAGSGQAERTVLNASGYVTARRSATVSSKVTGKVVELLIEEGMKVKEGQILARLDDTNVRASLELAVAQLISATNALSETRVRIREARQELKRQEGLIANKIATQADYDHAEANALAYEAQLQRQEADAVVAERTIATWRQQLDDTVIRAPFDGIVTSKNAQPGEMISPVSAGGGFTRTGICTIVDMKSLEIEIDVNESYINRVEPEQPVEATLDAYSDWKIPCKVIAIIPTADRQKSTVRVRVGFDKLDPRILPEMSIKVAFHEAATPGPAKASHGVIIPRSALQQVDGKDVVFILANGRAERRAVSVASSNGEESVLSAGVAAAEAVIVDPPTGLADGAGVREKPSR